MSDNAADTGLAPVADLVSLAGRTALVTGGATGIGEGIARRLASAGATVVIGDLDTDRAGKVAASLGGHALALDVTDAQACAQAVDRVVELTGRLDVLVNNAGTYRGIAASILDQDYATWRHGVEVNFHSVFTMSKPAAEAMVARGEGGAIVNIASVDGMLPCLGTSYDAAKGAVIQFTRSLALDLAPHQIRVNAVAPGHIMVETLAKMRSGELPPVWTPRSVTGLMGPMMRQRGANIPLGGSGEPDDIASTVLFLASPMSKYVIGQTITVDGGWMLV